MTYEVVDVQNISVQTVDGNVPTKYLVLKVEYTYENITHTRTFELNPSLTDEEINNIVVQAGQQIKQESTRQFDISGTI